MLERFYEIAGSRLRVRVPAQWSYPDEGVLTPFAVGSGAYDHTLEYAVVEQLSEPEGECVYRELSRQIYLHGNTQLRYEGPVEKSLDGAYMRIARQGDLSRIQVKSDSIPRGITPRLVLNAMEAEHLIAGSGGFLLHASYIRWQDKAILFTAPSGTGKSTQADLWCSLRGAELINGDRAAVRPGDAGAQVRGVPFCGSSGVAKNVTLPLAAIVYLSQAPATTITRLSGFRAFRQIWEGCSVNVWNRSDVDKSTQAVMDAVSAVPVYHLACTPDETAVAALQAALEKEGCL